LIEDSNSTASNYILLTVFSGFILVITIIMLLVRRTSQRITSSIDVMTEYTNELKKAPDIATKRLTIDRISLDPQFVKISKRYEMMRLAQVQLLERH